MPFERFLKARLFEPLGMTHPGFSVPESNLTLLATVYKHTVTGDLEPSDLSILGSPADPNRWPSGGGGLISTAGDYLRFAQMLQNGGSFLGKRYLSPVTVSLMTSNHVPDDAMFRFWGANSRGLGYGFGVGVVIDAASSPQAGFNGDYSWGGLLDTHWLVSPRTGIVAVLLTQRLFQRAQPAFVVTPLVDSFAIDGLAHLLGTRAVHGALGLVELHATRFELELAEFEEALHVPFEIVHHVFVLDPQDPAGKHVIPMRHELHIHPIIAGDVFDAVGELLPGSEQLLIVAEAAGDCVSARVDDLGVRQDQMNETEMAKVVRHLVNEKRLALAINPRVAEILCSEAAEVFWGKFGEYPRVARSRVARFAPAQILHQPRNVGELHRPLHFRVRGEDLLDEGGARSRQPHDEDGRGVRAPDPVAR